MCAYDTEEEMLAALSTFVAEGIEHNELIVFVHSFDSDDAAWRFVQRAAPSVPLEHQRQIVVVSLYTQAFQGAAAQIDHEHVGRVVESLVERARTDSRAGTRIFVDASRRYFAGERATEWFAFESWLGKRLQAKVGLVCAYQRSDIMRADILPEVLRTHAYRFEGS